MTSAKTFGYQKRLAFRSELWGLAVMLLVEAAGALALTLLLTAPWRYVVAGLIACATGATLFAATRILRTRHVLDADALQLRYGSFSLRLPLSAIRTACLFAGAHPEGPRPSRRPVWREAESAVYLLAAREGVVCLELRQPVEARSRRGELVPVSRVVLSLDSPDAFLEAVAMPNHAERGMGSQTLPVAPLPRHVEAVHACAEEGAPGQEPPALQLSGLGKVYGPFAAVKNLSLTLRRGEILAFLGSNGAGKSTTIRILAGLLRPSAGSAWIHGQDLLRGDPAVRRMLGYVPDVPFLHEGLTAHEFLRFMAGLYGLPDAEGRARSHELLAFFQMERWSDHLIRTFSLGMKRKMAIAAALVHRPKVLLLDEVTNGLDAHSARDVKDFIAQAAREGTSVLLTTHAMDVAMELSHRIAVVNEGELRALGTLAELQRAFDLPGAGLEELFLAITQPPRPRRSAV